MIVLLLVVMVASGVTGFYVYHQHQTIKQLTSSQNENTAQINAMKNSEDSQITTLNAELASFQAVNGTSFVNLQNRIENNDLNIGSLGEKIDATSSSISTLNSQIDSNLKSMSEQISNIIPALAADKVYSKVSPSIVQITDGTDTYGTGFIYDTSGHVITAAHVIQGISDITVILPDGTISKVSVVGSVLHSDVSVLKLAVTTSLTPVTLAADNSVAVGDAVLAVGHPYDLTNSLTEGVVSQIHRFESIDTATDQLWLADLIQFDAAVNPGNSGGPLFDENGNVVGMVVAGINPIFGSDINFAVSSARINQVANELIQNGSAAYPEIGVFVDDITQTEAASLGLNTVSGALVINLSPGLPADTAGILKGDIITAIGSTPINCASDLFSYFGGRAKLGENITVHIKRGGQNLSINVTTGGINENCWWVSMVPCAGSTATPWPES